MAAEVSPALAEVISALEPTKIPDKLHCPHCDGFLLNGYKLSCCDQSICENCYPKISDRCLICEHQPFTDELCKPNISLRKTAKAFLKTQEKRLADEREKSQTAAAAAELSAPTLTKSEDSHETCGESSLAASEETNKDRAAGSASLDESATEDPRSSPEIVTDSGLPILPIVGRDQDSDFNMNMSNRGSPTPAEKARKEQLVQEDISKLSTIGRDFSKTIPAAMGTDINLNGFPNLLSMNAGTPIIDQNQFMQYVNANGANAFQTLMGMSNMNMSQMPQGMFGGFGGPGMGVNGMNGLNGMNMGMNFNPNSGMFVGGWNGQNNNMWNGPQSNNPNAYTNGIGGDFGSNSGYGYNISQSTNFHQHQQQPQGDFGYYNRGPGRGRGRGRGAFNRNRNSFNSFSQANQPHFQNAHGQQQYEIHNMQSQMLNDRPVSRKSSGQKDDPKQNEVGEPLSVDDDEFAPGGQEEVQEALGADYHKSPAEEPKEQEAQQDTTVVQSIEEPVQLSPHETDAVDLTPVVDIQPDVDEATPVQSFTIYDEKKEVAMEPHHTEVPQESSKLSMPPPSAPSGPSTQHRESEDFGFRARGHNKFASRSRGSLSGLNGSPISPMRANLLPSPISPVDLKGVGVVGAPTGPKAMRESSAPKSNRPPSGSIGSNGGFKIMGRASMGAQDSDPHPNHRSRSNSPINGGENQLPEPRSTSRQHSRHSAQENSRYELEQRDEYDRDFDRDRKRSRKSRKDEQDDYEMQETERNRSRSHSPSDRKSSHRSRRDRDHHTSSSRRRPSSRSRRHTNGDKSEDQDDFAAILQSSRDAPIETSESRSSHRGHRSSKSSKYDDRDRDRDRERERGREDRHRDRKRSRHDYDGANAAPDDEDESSRHRSRRHKREHRDESTPTTNGNGAAVHRPSEVVVPIEPQSDRSRDKDKDKDPHTLEREARNRERMAKEMQRREKARQDDHGGGAPVGPSGASKRSHGGRISGGRRVSYKYEDDVQSSMVESERESARWR